MGTLFRGIVVASLAVSLGLSAFASWRGIGLNRLDRSIAPSVRNQSVFGPWFSGRGYRGGK
jgi:hypothetical protein